MKTMNPMIQKIIQKIDFWKVAFGFLLLFIGPLIEIIYQVVVSDLHPVMKTATLCSLVGGYLTAGGYTQKSHKEALNRQPPENKSQTK